MNKIAILVIVIIIVIIVSLVCTVKFGIIDKKKKEHFEDVEDEFNDFIGEDIEDIDYDDNEENNNQEYSAYHKDVSGINKKLLKSIEEKLKNKFNNNDELGVLITNPEYAEYKGNNTKLSKKDLMDSSLLLPGKVSEQLKKDFNLPPEAVKLDNNNLITVNKSIGVNTVGSSLRNASHDIRGDMLVGKSYQGPWNMSTIEADINNVGLANI